MLKIFDFEMARDYLTLIEDIRFALEEYAEEERITFAETSHPTSMQILGVSVPNVKLVLRELKVEAKSFSGDEKLALIKSLIDEDVFELQQMAFEYFEANRKELIPLLSEDYIGSIEKNLDNWLSADYFATFIIGYAWREGIISTARVKSYLKSEDSWIRRMPIIATGCFNAKSRGGTGDTKRTLDILELVVDDHEKNIVQALSWALRTLARIDREATFEFIEIHEEQLHRTVLREVRKFLDRGIRK